MSYLNGGYNGKLFVGRDFKVVLVLSRTLSLSLSLLLLAVSTFVRSVIKETLGNREKIGVHSASSRLALIFSGQGFD
jgi:hypothetical protein